MNNKQASRCYPLRVIPVRTTPGDRSTSSVLAIDRNTKRPKKRREEDEEKTAQMLCGAEAPTRLPYHTHHSPLCHHFIVAVN
jgi:hypothetical protein